VGECSLQVRAKELFRIAKWTRVACCRTSGSAPRSSIRKKPIATFRKLLKVPAPVRFLSCEPLLGAIDLTKLPTVVGELREFMLGLPGRPAQITQSSAQVLLRQD
jgi:hypothetical protein